MNRHLTGLAAAAALLALPASASATWHGASPDVLAEGTIGCTAAPSCTIAPELYTNIPFTDLPLGGAQRGVVVGWRINGAGGTVRLRRIGATPGATGVETLGERRSHEFGARLPVQEGDLIGIDLGAGATVGFVPDDLGLGGDTLRRWEPALADGAAAPAATAIPGYALFQIDVEPDADGDALGDTTQDPDRGSPGGGDRDGGDRGGGDGGGSHVPEAGPTVGFGATGATRKGTVTVGLSNPYAVSLRGRLTVRLGRRAAGSASVSLPAAAARTVKVKLSKAAARQLLKKRSLKLTAAVTLRAATGKARTTAKALTFALPPSGPGARGYDGTYGAPDGQRMVIRGGIVQSFSGDLTLWCTKSKVQKRTFYAMIGDDPKARVAPNGSFAWEATRGYGFEKLRFSGQVKGRVATGRLMVEDRSPLPGGDRIEFDYCFAGKKFRLTR